MQPFGPWLPDIAAFESSAATVANNVVPDTRSYRPWQNFSAISAALPETVLGASSARRQTSRETYNFLGTGTALYQLNTSGTSWANVTRTVGGIYTTPSDGFWSFSTFGDNVIAANFSDATQTFQLGVSTNFAALGGSAPRAQFVGNVRDFVVLASTSTNLSRIQWSAINNSADWVPSAATMSDSQDFPEGGVITGFSGGDVGVVFCERAIYRMAFEGPPTIFRFDRIAANMGCRASRSIAAYENLIFFLSHDGFYMVRGASEIVPIGVDKVDRWFVDNVNAGMTYKITSAVDPVRKLYVVGFPQGTSTTANKLLVYHWPTGQWATEDFSHDLVYSASKQGGVTIDGMDTIAATIDALPYTIDSIFYSGTYNVALSGFDSLHRSGFFEGTAAEATVETGDVQLTPGRKSMVRGLRPMIDGDNPRASLVMRARDNLHEPLFDSEAEQATNSGFCNTRVNARYHRAKIVIPPNTDWIHAMGVDDIKFSSMGAR